ncbi:MAG: maleylacetate reductase [Rhizobiales bacterium]|nr:maleylacetate reductase [Hyphomicrobiales bacterium]
MIAPFRYEPKPARVLFGAGWLADVAAAVSELGGTRALVLSTRGQNKLAEQVASHLGALAVGQFNGATMHTPVAVTEEALAHVAAMKADCLVAVGGGSTIGLGKAIALRTDLPQIAIPTTYAGSEMTDILGETKDGAKTTQRTPKVLPETVIYDVDLTLRLPAVVSATSGMNAIAHGVEALYAADTNPVIALMAEDGIRRLASALPVIMTNLGNSEARAQAMLGGFLCGTCLGSAAMALHHKICHVLGGMFNLPHAETHTVMLPHTAAYNAEAAPAAMAAVARALGVNNAITGLAALKLKLVGPMSLASLGMPEEGIEPAARAAVANPYPNPRALGLEPIRAMIARAFHGTA